MTGTREQMAIGGAVGASHGNAGIEGPAIDRHSSD
jgi:hypothetical protein